MTWMDPVRKRYKWAQIEGRLEELIYELSKAEDEEEAGLYLLRLHYENGTDMVFFTVKEKRRIRKLLAILIEDTKRHRELIAGVVRKLAEAGPHAEQGL
jgi:hypothetical protein